ncbi:hypothetical protein [Microcoleus sp. N3A4]|uniref:hypothetical protein n=1 Tax=Microcoleus sp. N3A4 TaxID=3055379 RepID=UPI002FCF2D10
MHDRLFLSLRFLGTKVYAVGAMPHWGGWGGSPAIARSPDRPPLIKVNIEFSGDRYYNAIKCRIAFV